MIRGVKVNGVYKSFLWLLAAGLFLLSVTAASAQVSPGSAPESLRSPALKQFEDDGGTVEFIGTAHGLDGWVARNSKGEVKTTVYTTPDGAMVAGMLFASDGTNETAKQLEAYHGRITGSQAAAPGAENSSSKAEKLYAEVEKAGWVSFGNSQAPYLYIFMNVNCDHCQDFWKDLESTVQDNKLQVRLVPYGTSEENRDGGAALLSVANPQEVWSAYISGDKTALGKDKAKDEGYQKLDADRSLRYTAARAMAN
jgi:protein-disulfide isomerase